MTPADTLAPYARLTAPDTLTLERLLRGPIERVWAYLTDSDKRRKWLAAGEMVLEPGAEFTLTWRNDDLTHSSDIRPEGFSGEHSASCRLIAAEPPHRLAYDWPGVGEVEIMLAPERDRVRLTLTHRRTPNRNTTVMVSAGWHTHLDLLQSHLEGRTPATFWQKLLSLRDDYQTRTPA